MDKDKEIMKKARELEKTLQSIPDWYWRSLHDAEITRFETEENLQDYKNDRHNRFSIYLDTSNALGDRRVKEIHFYNYKFINPSYTNFDGITNCWWLDDNLTRNENGIYRFKIFFDEMTLDFTFKQIEVVRNEKMRW